MDFSRSRHCGNVYNCPFMELWATLFARCGKDVSHFPHLVNSVVHDGMDSYAHFHDALYLFYKDLFFCYKAGFLSCSVCSCVFFCKISCPKYCLRFSRFLVRDFTSFSQFL